ncbi:MAG: hypothetical protein ABW208_16310 [Pyrinomonadaceae bacterium]
MRPRQRISFSLLAALVITAVTAMAALRMQDNEHVPAGQQKGNDVKALFEDYPIVDLNAPEPADPEARALRRARSDRHNNTDLSPANVKRFMFQEGMGLVSLGVPTAHSPTEPAFPVAECDVIAIGEVTDAQAHLSTDKTNVYSEFVVRIEEVLTADPPEHVAVGNSITTERFGGRVRLPSGAVALTGFMGKSMPLVGRRYLLFLKLNEAVQTYSIVTGYEVRAGRISPLDGNRRFKVGDKFDQLAAYDRYEGAGEETFLKEVKDAVAKIKTNKNPGAAPNEDRDSLRRFGTSRHPPRLLFVTSDLRKNNTRGGSGIVYPPARPGG